MDDEKTILRIISVFTTGIITLIHIYSMRGINIHETWPIALVLYFMLLSTLGTLYVFLKNGTKQFTRKIEYVRLLAAFLFVIAFAYNVFLV